MPTCDVCRRRVDLPHRCTQCEGTYCGSHRLPETHDCTALDDWGDAGGFGARDGVDGAREASPRRGEGEAPTGLARVGEAFEGNVTYVFLALMTVTFAAQYLLFPLAGYGPRTEVWQATFLVTTAHPEYVWTWFTSIFAHGGTFHLLGNGIVIFFFGRLVEEYLGSRRYALLFLATGAFAGLSQIGVLVAQGVDSGGLGASGAAFAIMGMLTGMNPRLRVYVYFLVPVPIWLFTGGYTAVMIQTIEAGGTTAGGVAHFAHLSGLVAGLGYGLYEKRRGGRLPDRLQFGGAGRG
jgi:membrane associated rhomboid family serine protease